VAKPILSDDLWAVIEPLLPVRKRRFRFPGRKPLDDRKCLMGILYVLKTGIQWEYLPQELGYGSGMTCWRRLRDWQTAGVWDRLHHVLLERMHEAGEIDWERVAVDSSHVRARGAGEKNRSIPRGSQPSGQQAPPRRRRKGHASRRASHGGERP
jgi:transposase